MLQNKIYRNYIKEIFKNFFVVLLSFSLIAWVVKAVNYLELIIDSGYSVLTYLFYSFLSLTAVITKFIPLAFLVVIVFFLSKMIEEKEFVILWSAGVKKINLVNLLFLTSILILFFYLFFSIFLTPYTLNKSRKLLSDKSTTSIIPTIKKNQFSDTFKGLTIIVEEKEKNEVKNIFIFDTSDNFKNLNSNKEKNSFLNIISKNGIIENNQMILINGQIVNTSYDGIENEIINFDQMNINMSNLDNNVIKKPKIQETSTNKLLNCFSLKFNQNKFCSSGGKVELIPTLNRRIILPFYIPIISLICCYLLIHSSKKIVTNKSFIFILSFLVLLFSELTIRYTGLNKFLNFLFILLPFVTMPLLYLHLNYQFKHEVIK